MAALVKALHLALRPLPIGFVSDLGARLARLNVRFVNPQVAQNARRNVRRHFPDLPEAEVEALVRRFVGNVGRLMTEFSVIHRFAAAKRMEFVGVDVARVDVGKIPTIALCLHLGNWEVLAGAMQAIGIPVASISEVRRNEAQRDIAAATRRGFDLRVLAPDQSGLRQALSILRGNGVLAIFPDEKRDGTMMAPLFGRPPHAKGNLALVARLARRTGAQLVVTYCERVDATHFRLCFEPPFQMKGEGPGMLADVALLNSRIEPVILRHLDQWYYLDDPIGPIEPEPADRAGTPDG
ncbi:hypothetical protein MWN34_08785 [Ancylobacter sp. 6x-1]|uniref:Lipid A biosynthesis lauroyl acyltransferase n=1 Tax=Ancylobacter crimeensis TaxID=2579147 RepID=A0ABT0DAM8_9HYPH|nr:hypothetical protein [Ancylobacter crimeensis]MCK0197008.1 hypothetical protein [Ancylobacter crimeensis]